MNIAGYFNWARSHAVLHKDNATVIWKGDYHVNTSLFLGQSMSQMSFSYQDGDVTVDGYIDIICCIKHAEIFAYTIGSHEELITFKEMEPTPEIVDYVREYITSQV